MEIGIDNDHVHFLVQSTSDYIPSKIVKIIKSLTQVIFMINVLGCKGTSIIKERTKVE
ncbi:MAG: transposase [Longibaculum sp.]